MLVGRQKFGRVEILPAQRRLLVDGREQALGARAFDMLLVLVEHRDRIVAKDELLDRVWPGMVVEENNLPVQVSALRKLLGPQAIATIPGRGYRFTLVDEAEPPAADAPVAPVAATAPASPAADEASDITLPAERPPAPRLDLPSDAEPIIGREEEVYDIVALLAEQRLVTLVGAGGMGKTRLARAVMKRLREDFVDGVWWVDLAALDPPRGAGAALATGPGHARTADAAEPLTQRLVQTLAAALGVATPASGDVAAPATAAIEALADRLRPHSRRLVVLDNCEHLAPAVAHLVAGLLEALPTLRLLLTSRTPLHLASEQVWRLEALAVPAAGSGLAAARRCAAFELFETRARAGDRRFRIEEAQLPAAIELCRRLEGHALSIEMAATRAPQLGLAGLLARLDERLRLLRSADPLQPARQLSLRTTLDWSCSLLSATEQVVLWRLAVFAGWFGLDEAQAVAADADGPADGPADGAGEHPGSLDAWAVLDALAVLVDHSLVQMALPAGAGAGDGTAPEGPRYRLAETTRLYGLERLTRQPDEAATRARWQALRGDAASRA